MAQQYLFRFLVLIAVFASEVFSRPSNNEPTTPLTIDMEATEITDTGFKEERTLTYDNGAEYVGDGTNAKEIVNKIKEINNALKAPKRKPPVINNAPPYTGGGYVIDKDTLDKLQNIIASGMEPMPLTHKYQESNTLSNDDLGGPRKIRNIPYGLSNQFPVEGNQAQISSLAYLTSIPVLVMSTNNNGYSNDLNSITTNSIYQTRQSPSLPFPSPFASIFPILIRDPILSIMSGGGFSNFMQFGQSADVCNRKQKAVLGDNRQQDLTENQGEEQDDLSNNFKYSTPKSRQARALKKRTLSSTTPLENNIENLNKVKKLFTAKATTRKPIKQTYIEQEQPQDTKTVNADEGDLRFPFLGSDFTWFGNKKPVAPSPGFFINRLKVRRGGVAIAGPGGVATAGRGGTAIVGPGGLAYTQPGGLAVAGPAARVIALSSDTDLSSIVARLQEQTATDGSVPRLLEAIPEGKVVATGPVIFYHPNEQTYYRGAGWRGFQGDYRRENFGFSRRSDEYQYNGASIVKGPWMSKDSFVLHLKPVAHATNAPRGVAVANPVSNVLVSRNDYGSIIHTPTASAVVGPGGIAHAQSDLYLYEYY